MGCMSLKWSCLNVSKEVTEERGESKIVRVIITITVVGVKLNVVVIFINVSL